MQRILKNFGVKDIEAVLVNVLNSDNPADSEISILLSSSTLLLDVWTYIFLTTLSQHKKLTVRVASSYLSLDKSKNKIALFRNLEGLACVHRKMNIISHTTEAFKYSADEVKESILVGDYLEDQLEQTKVFTFIAWDPKQTHPSSMPKIRDFSRSEAFMQFSDWFDRVLERFFPAEKKNLAQVKDPSQHTESNYLLRRIIFELYANTFEHGRLLHQDNAQDSIIAAPRFIRMSKIIDNSVSNIIKRVKNFDELEEYFTNVNRKGSAKFYSITVSDCGMGIAARFKSKSEKYRETDIKDEVLINKIIEQGLSSKLGIRNSGEGLRRVCECLDETNSFMTIRTGSAWLCRKPNIGKRSTETQFIPVSSSVTLASVTGTHINIVFPMSV